VSENKSSHETRQESGFLRHSFKKQIHNLSRNANSQKQSDIYSSTAAGAPSLPRLSEKQTVSKSDLFPLKSKKTHKMQVRREKKLKKPSQTQMPKP
jgi:hypothetical protein